MQANYDNEIIDFEEINSVDEKELEILTKIQSVTESLQKQGLIEPNIQDKEIV